MLTNYKLVDEYYDDEDPVITNKNDKKSHLKKTLRSPSESLSEISKVKFKETFFTLSFSNIQMTFK